ncbi:DEKNAAC102984 [Brettanomyces naardenensis]|uniref:DEKNAAC102984 n=1 Tax=Brettanomyces naardenensis TaxID=13370 RepID=A0A448YM67_BRENA|nr:DEKNAAC102984 [Brettanomyces naardenensis]
MKFSTVLYSLILATAATAAPVALPHAAHHSHKKSSGKKFQSKDIDGNLDDFSDPTDDFVDGTIPCSTFPTNDGVISVGWVGLNGWASISNANGETSDSCTDGYYCSYACQPGMTKTQWPSAQPADGSTVGGLYCKAGFLYRTNQNTNHLCEWGAKSASIQSQLKDVVSLCRTDYPGSENMVIPTEVEGGSSKPLCVIDEDTYFTWEGKKTSAQYYVNNAGVSAEDGCIWGDSSKAVGNYAPLVIGAGYTDGLAYISLIPNPNSVKAGNFNVEIVAADNSEINGDCSYSNGAFSGDGTDGCTVTVKSGSAILKFN